MNEIEILAMIEKEIKNAEDSKPNGPFDYIGGLIYTTKIVQLNRIRWKLLNSLDEMAFDLYAKAHDGFKTASS